MTAEQRYRTRFPVDGMLAHVCVAFLLPPFRCYGIRSLADSKQLARLKKGVDGWNRWRQDHPRVRPDLSGADLAEANLTKANLDGVPHRRRPQRGTSHQGEPRGADLARRPAPPPPLSSSATKSLTDADHFGMIRTAQRRFAPTVIGITRNSDRHQIGMSNRHRRNTQQRPLASGAILQGAEADIEDQNVCGDQRQCGAHAGVDGVDRDAGAEVPAVEIEVLVVVIALAALLRQQLFFYRDLWAWLDDPFQAPPALAGVHDDAQQLEITW